MVLSFIGLLGLQISYIEEMAKMKREQFEESVTRALYQASHNMELNETLQYLEKDVHNAEKRATVNDSVTVTGAIGGGVQRSHQYSVTSDDGTIYSSFQLQTISLSPRKMPKGLVVKNDKSAISEAQKSMQEIVRNRYIYQKSLLDRYAGLYEKGLISAQDYETYKYNWERSKSSYNQAYSNYQKSKKNIGYSWIYSPVDGIVLTREVDEGQTVAAGFNTPTLFTIAKDLTDMQCIADVDEADIGGVKEGQRVTFTVDAFPDDVFSGTVKQVRQNATTTNNVVTYEVVITAPNADLKLKPGLTANVTIYTLERNGVVSVPSAALRFTPEPSIIGKRYVIKDVPGEKKLWTLEGNVFTAHKVETGITDGVHTEIKSGLEEGAVIVLDMVAGRTEQDAQQGGSEENSPFMPGPRNRNNKSGGSNAKK